jgi:hypothetical protein
LARKLKSQLQMLRFRHHGIKAKLKQNCHQPDTLLRVTTRVIMERTYEGIVHLVISYSLLGCCDDVAKQTVAFYLIKKRVQQLHVRKREHTRRVRLAHHFPP